MEHFIARFSDTGMIVLLVTSAIVIGAAGALLIVDAISRMRQIDRAQKVRQMIREHRIAGKPLILDGEFSE